MGGIDARNSRWHHVLGHVLFHWLYSDWQLVSDQLESRGDRDPIQLDPLVSCVLVMSISI